MMPIEHELLLEQIQGAWKVQAIFAAINLGIIDLLVAGDSHYIDISTQIEGNIDAVYRLLRGLVSLGICGETSDGVFHLSSKGRLLDKNHSNTLHFWALWSATRVWCDWGELSYSIKTGASSRSMLSGLEGFKYQEQNQEANQIFNQAMGNLTRQSGRELIEVHDFSRYQKVVDVGGGSGYLLQSILCAFPKLKGVLFDRPNALPSKQDITKDSSIADRIVLEAGDFFDAIPSGADAVLLKSILHDWCDEDCRKILESCSRSMCANNKLIVIERVLPKHVGQSLEDQDACRSDLSMLVGLGGRERTRFQLTELISSAGFIVEEVVPLKSGLHLLEASKTSDNFIAFQRQPMEKARRFGNLEYEFVNE